MRRRRRGWRRRRRHRHSSVFLFGRSVRSASSARQSRRARAASSSSRQNGGRPPIQLEKQCLREMDFKDTFRAKSGTYYRPNDTSEHVLMDDRKETRGRWRIPVKTWLVRRQIPSEKGSRPERTHQSTKKEDRDGTTESRGGGREGHKEKGDNFI
jgi:hypothetical protein